MFESNLLLYGDNLDFLRDPESLLDSHPETDRTALPALSCIGKRPHKLEKTLRVIPALDKLYIEIFTKPAGFPETELVFLLRVDIRVVEKYGKTVFIRKLPDHVRRTRGAACKKEQVFHQLPISGKGAKKRAAPRSWADSN